MRVRVVTRAMRGLLSVFQPAQAVEICLGAFQLWSHKCCAGWCRCF